MQMWLEEMRPALLRYCRSLCGGSRWEAEDLVQDTLLKLINRQNEQENRPINKAYVFRSAKNLWIDNYRRRSRHPVLSIHELQQDPAMSEDSSYSTRELLESLAYRLPPRSFVILLLYDIFGFTAKETASVLGGTEGSVQVAAGRARGRLRKLAQRGDAESDRSGSHGEACGAEDDTITGKTMQLLDAVLDAFRRQDPKLIYHAYLRLFESGARISAIRPSAGKLFFTIRDPDGNMLMVTS